MGDEVAPDRLASVELFAGLSDEERSAVAATMRLQRFARGGVVAEEGDLPTKFFVMLDGHVTVHRDGRHVADLGPGEVFGEAGAAALQPRNASVIATTPVEVAVMMGWDLRDLMTALPALGARVEALIADRASSA
jgi:CRP/FNR family transcriptional regulator, cyclic AMP receptor protein